MYMYMGWVRVNPNPIPLRISVLVEDLSLLPFNPTFRNKLKPQ